MKKNEFFYTCLIVLTVYSFSFKNEHMKESKVSKNTTIRTNPCEKYDFKKMLDYSDTNYKEDKVAEPVTIVDLVNSDSNEKNISLLLSSQKISFVIQRSKGWSSNYLFIQVSKKDENQVREIISCASEANIIKVQKNIKIRGQNNNEK